MRYGSRAGRRALVGRLDDAERRFEEALAICRSIGDEVGVAILLHRLADMSIALRGDLTRGRFLAEESLAGHRRTGFRKGEAHALTTLATIARADGDLEGVLELLQDAERITEETNFRWWQSGVLAKIGAVSLELGRIEDARRSAQEAARLSRTMNDRKALVYELALLAEIGGVAGDSRQAGTLWGAAEAENERMWTGRWLHGTVEPERVLAYADEDFELGRAVGRELSVEAAIALALEDGVAPT